MNIEEKDDVMTVGSLLKMLSEGLKSGKLKSDSPILYISDEFNSMGERHNIDFTQLSDPENMMESSCFTAAGRLEDLDSDICRYKKKIDELSRSTMPDAAITKDYYVKLLNKAVEDKKDFEEWLKQDAVVIA